MKFVITCYGLAQPFHIFVSFPSFDNMDYIKDIGPCICEYSVIPYFLLHGRDSSNILTVTCHQRTLGVPFLAKTS